MVRIGFQRGVRGVGKIGKGGCERVSIGGDWEIEDSGERSGVWDWTGRWGGDWGVVTDL